MEDKLTVREACRRRMPLGGVDAEALEHGMTQLEEENKKLRQMYENLEFATRMARQAHPDGCVQAGLMLKEQFEKMQKDLHEKDLQNDELKATLRAIVEPILEADEAKDKDKHTFCNCLYCRAWALYDNEKPIKRKCEKHNWQPDPTRGPGSYCQSCNEVWLPA